MSQPVNLAEQFAPPPTDSASTISAYRWTLAWLVLAVVLWFFAKLAIGKTILYYLVILSLFFLIVTQYQAIAALLSPFNQGGKNG